MKSSRSSCKRYIVQVARGRGSFSLCVSVMNMILILCSSFQSLSSSAASYISDMARSRNSNAGTYV